MTNLEEIKLAKMKIFSYVIGDIIKIKGGILVPPFFMSRDYKLKIMALIAIIL